MPRVTYTQAAEDAIVESALNARDAGKTWSETCQVAKSAGFKGSVSSLQKMVGAAKANVVGTLKPSQPAANKGPAKALKSAATGANAFKKTGGAASISAQRKPRGNAPESARLNLPILKNGRMYQRPISLFDGDFRMYGKGELEACSHILEKEEVLRVVNSNSSYPRGGDVVVDCTLSPVGSSLTVLLNSAQAREPKYSGSHPAGTQAPVQRRWDGTTYVSIREVGPNETLILTNAPVKLARALA